MTYSPEYVNEILDNFDFKKVRKTMKKLDWTWVNINTNEPYYPTTDQLHNEASRLLNNTANALRTMNEYTTGCGGFEVRGGRFGYKIYLKLSFVVEAWDNYD